MEPVEVLGLGYNLLRFSYYGAELLSSSEEITESAVGTPASINTHETRSSYAENTLSSILDHLSILSRELASRLISHTELWQEDAEEVRRLVWKFQEIASQLRDDCDKILNDFDRVRRTAQFPCRWASPRILLQGVVSASDVDNLERRCHDNRGALSTVIYAFMKLWISRYQGRTNEMREDRLRFLEEVPEQFQRHVAECDNIARIQHILQDLSVRIGLGAAGDGHRPSVLIEPDEISDFRAQLNELALQAADVDRKKEILSSLAFDGQNVRQQSIPLSVNSMFDWVFKPAEGEAGPNKRELILDWLKVGKIVGHLTAAAGTGKAMLLRHILRHPDLYKTLCSCSDPNYPRFPIIASYFFSTTGTSFQRSREALCQAILRSLLLQLPNCYEVACPSQWKSQPNMLRDRRWSLSELHQSIVNILSKEINYQFFFFIESVDSYDGNVADLLHYFAHLAGVHTVKVLTTSKPLDIATSTSFSLIDLKLPDDVIRYDLEILIASNLEHHYVWKNKLASPADRFALARRMSRDPGKTILWGQIATICLQKWTSDSSNLVELQKLATEMPCSIPELIKQLMLSMPKKMASTSAVMFQAALEATEPAPLMIYHFLRREHDDSDYALKLEPRAFDSKRIRQYMDEAEDELRAYSADLLCVRCDGRVEFSHAAIEDVIRVHGLVANAFDRKMIASYDTKLGLVKAHLAYIKTSELSWGSKTSSEGPLFTKALSEMLEAYREVDDTTEAYVLLDELDNVVEARKNETLRLRRHVRKSILNAGVVGFIRYKLSKHATYFQPLTEVYNPIPVLSLVLSSLYSAAPASLERGRHAKVLSCLLRHDHAPNEAYQEGEPTLTPWTSFIRSNMDVANFRWSLDCNMHTNFLDAGADPNAFVWFEGAPVEDCKGRKYIQCWVLYICTLLKPAEGWLEHLDGNAKEAAIGLLDRFAASGANAKNSPLRRIFKYNDEEMEDNAWITELIRLGIRSLPSGKLELEHGKLPFQLQIVERVLGILSRSGVDLGPCWQVLRMNLRPTLCEALERSYYGRSDMKRRVSSNGGGIMEQVWKRARTEMDDGSIIRVSNGKG